MTNDLQDYVGAEMLDALRHRPRPADEGKLVEVVSNDYLALGGGSWWRCVRPVRSGLVRCPSGS
ncbi:hypothetical protein GCM10023329_00200 [Streptomyces sanyensis]|uniref:Uncharacterized protein n=1 Tax=Streptomyces sanyensis TaxID=568869 RepID=A0ABP8ZLE6_9ACTN